MLNRPQIQRYSRHLLLEEVGATGQRRLLDARVTVVEVGGGECQMHGASTLTTRSTA